MAKYIKQMANIEQKEVDDLERTVKDIINDVRKNGDEALKEYSRKFDGVELDELRVSQEEIEKAMSRISTTTLEDIKYSI